MSISGAEAVGIISVDVGSVSALALNWRAFAGAAIQLKAVCVARLSRQRGVGILSKKGLEIGKRISSGHACVAPMPSEVRVLSPKDNSCPLLTQGPPKGETSTAFFPGQGN